MEWSDANNIHFIKKRKVDNYFGVDLWGLARNHVGLYGGLLVLPESKFYNRDADNGIRYEAKDPEAEVEDIDIDMGAENVAAPKNMNKKIPIGAHKKIPIGAHKKIPVSGGGKRPDSVQKTGSGHKPDGGGGASKVSSNPPSSIQNNRAQPIQDNGGKRPDSVQSIGSGHKPDGGGGASVISISAAWANFLKNDPTRKEDSPELIVLDEDDQDGGSGGGILSSHPSDIIMSDGGSGGGKNPENLVSTGSQTDADGGSGAIKKTTGIQTDGGSGAIKTTTGGFRPLDIETMEIFGGDDNYKGGFAIRAAELLKTEKIKQQQETRIQELNSIIARMEATQSSSKTSMQGIKEAHTRELKELQDKYDALFKENQKQIDEINDLAADKMTYDAEVKRLNREKTDLQLKKAIEISNIENTKNNKIRELEHSLKLQMASNTSFEADYRQKLKLAEAHYKRHYELTAKTHITEIESLNKQLQSQSTMYNDAINKKQDEINALQAKIQNDTRNQELQRQLDEAKMEKASIAQKYDNHLERMRKLKENFDMNFRTQSQQYEGNLESIKRTLENTASSYAKVQRQLEEQQSQNLKMKTEMSTIANQKQMIESSSKALEEQLKTESQKNTNLRSQISELTNQKLKMRLQLTNQQTQIHSLTNTIESKENQLKILQKSFEEMKRQIDTEMGDPNANVSVVLAKQESNEELRRQIQQLNADVESLQNQKTNIENLLKTERKSKAELQALSVAAQKKIVDKMNQEITRLTQQINKEKAVVRTGESKDDASEIITELEKQLAMKQTLVNQLQTKMNEVDTSLIRIQNENHQMKSANLSLTNKITNLEKQARLLQLTIDKHNNTILQLKKEQNEQNQNNSTTIEKLTQTKNSLEAELKQIQSEQIDFKTQKMVNDLSIKGNEETILNLKNQISALETNVKELKQMNTTLKSEKEEKITEMTSKTTSLEAQIRQYQSDIQQLNSGLLQKETQINNSTQSLNEYIAKYTQLDSNFKQMAVDYASLKKQRQELQNKFDTMSSEMQALKLKQNTIDQTNKINEIVNNFNLKDSMEISDEIVDEVLDETAVQTNIDTNIEMADEKVDTTEQDIVMAEQQRDLEKTELILNEYVRASYAKGVKDDGDDLRDIHMGDRKMAEKIQDAPRYIEDMADNVGFTDPKKWESTMIAGLKRHHERLLELNQKRNQYMAALKGMKDENATEKIKAMEKFWKDNNLNDPYEVSNENIVDAHKYLNGKMMDIGFTPFTSIREINSRYAVYKSNAQGIFADIENNQGVQFHPTFKNKIINEVDRKVKFVMENESKRLSPEQLMKKMINTVDSIKEHKHLKEIQKQAKSINQMMRKIELLMTKPDFKNFQIQFSEYEKKTANERFSNNVMKAKKHMKSRFEYLKGIYNSYLQKATKDSQNSSTVNNVIQNIVEGMDDIYEGLYNDYVIKERLTNDLNAIWDKNYDQHSERILAMQKYVNQVRNQEDNIRKIQDKMRKFYTASEAQEKIHEIYEKAHNYTTNTKPHQARNYLQEIVWEGNQLNALLPNQIQAKNLEKQKNTRLNKKKWIVVK